MANRLVTWRKDGARKGLGSARRTAHDGLTPPLIVDSDKPNAKRRGSGKFIRSPQAFLLEKYQGMKKVSKMAKVDIGTKRVCPECEAKFYDLNRNPAICPMCQHSFDPSELDPNVILPTAPLKPQTSKADDDGDEDMEDAVEVDEDDIDEEEQAVSYTHSEPTRQEAISYAVPPALNVQLQNPRFALGLNRQTVKSFGFRRAPKVLTVCRFNRAVSRQ